MSNLGEKDKAEGLSSPWLLGRYYGRHGNLYKDQTTYSNMISN